MSNHLFEYYREELRFLYEQGREFGQTHGDEASLLDFDRDTREDPFVRRLVEAFAFLTARVQMKLDDDFPQIAAALLEKLLPLATQSFPAFSIVQLEPGDQVKPGGEFLRRTETRLMLENYSDAFFSTCYDTRCYALDITSCKLKRDFPESRHTFAKPAVSALKLTIAGSDGLPLDAALNGEGVLRKLLMRICKSVTIQNVSLHVVSGTSIRCRSRGRCSIARRPSPRTNRSRSRGRCSISKRPSPSTMFNNSRNATRVTMAIGLSTVRTRRVGSKLACHLSPGIAPMTCLVRSIVPATTYVTFPIILTHSTTVMKSKS